MSVPRYTSYSESGVDWLGLVPSHWSLKRLAHYFEERRTKVSDKDYPPLSVTKSGIVPQLVTAAKSDDSDNRKLVLTGDFVINSRSDRKGSSGLSELDGSVSLINTVLEPNYEIDARFAHHLLRSVAFQEEFYRYGKGIVADLWSTNFSEMRNILLAIPPLPEQAAIAAFIDRETAKIDALVEEQRRLIELLKEKRQAVISYWVTKGLDPTASTRDSGVEWLGDVPAHWVVMRLARLWADVKAGPFGSAITKDMYVPSGYRVYGQEQVIPGDFSIGDYYISEEDFDALRQYEVKPKDILISCVGTFGKIALVPSGIECGIINPRLIRIRTGSRLIPEYLCVLLRSGISAEQLSALSRGGTMDVINIGVLGALTLPVPPIDEQVEIVRTVTDLENEFAALSVEASRAIELLRERRAALISAAVTGKIDVRAAEAVRVEAEAA